MQDSSSDEEVYGSASELIDNEDRQRYNDEDCEESDRSQNENDGDNEHEKIKIEDDDERLINLDSDNDDMGGLSEYEGGASDSPTFDNTPDFFVNPQVYSSVPNSPDHPTYDDASSSDGNNNESDLSDYNNEDYESNEPNYKDIFDYVYEDMARIDTRNDIISQLSDIFYETFTPRKAIVAIANNTVPKEIEKYCNLINDLDLGFTTDLPLHLYSVYLLNTRNKNLPLPKFTLWPLPSRELITPRVYLNTTNFKTLGYNANDIRNELEKTRYTAINYEENAKLLDSRDHMWEYWHPKINANEELGECIDAIFERKINSQIAEYAESHVYTKKNHYVSDYTYQRRAAEDLTLDPIFKSKIIDKLDSIIDKLTDVHTNAIKNTAKISRKLGTFSKHDSKNAKVTDYGLDWLSVLACLDQKDKQSKLTLLNLFNLKLDRDRLHGPVNSYKIDNEIYHDTKIRRDRILKSLAYKIKPKVKYPKNTKYAKIAKKQRSHIRYNLDSFINLNFIHTKARREKKTKRSEVKEELVDDVNDLDDVNDVDDIDDVDDVDDEILE